MALLKVKPWGEDQGEFVLIEEEDFNEEKHELLDEKAPEIDVKRQRRTRRTTED